MTARPLRVLIAASHTGGHLLPALFIARAFQRKVPGVEIEFVGSGRPLEEKIIVANGFPRRIISAVGLKKRGAQGALEFVGKLPRALSETNRILKDFEPDIVVGVGGYVSVLPVALASLKRIPTWIHEAELSAGLSNLALSTVASQVSLGFPGAHMPRWARTIVTGHPLRPEILTVANEKQPAEAPRRLLIMGGSQGARAIDQALAALAPFLASKGLQIRHQSRPENIPEVESAYRAAGVDATVLPFIEDMAEAYRWADVVLARAGAGTVLELSSLNIPAIFVPFPFAAGDEQSANAMTLVEKGKAELVREGEQFPERLRAALERVLDPAAYRRMVEGGPSIPPVDSSEKIVDGCLALLAGTR